MGCVGTLRSCAARSAEGREQLCMGLLMTNLCTRHAFRWLQGYHGDTSAMFTCGEVSAEAQRLCDATKEALHAAIAVYIPTI